MEPEQGGGVDNDKINVTLTIDDNGVDARMRDVRPDVVALFAGLDEPSRCGLGRDAWQIGLRALKSAYQQAEEAKLADIGRDVITGVERHLGDYVKRHQEAIVDALRRYFDPRDGQVMLRLEAFVRDDGDIARAMGQFLAPDQGVLAQALARQVGENSPLLRRLSPTDSEGFLHLCAQRLEDVLTRNQSAMTRALDPLDGDGAVGRFLHTLRHELERAEHDRNQQLVLATKALDANDENSLLSRLVRETETSRREFLKAVNPQLPDSPLAILQQALTKLLEDQGRVQRESMQSFQESQLALTKEVRDAIVRIEERRRADDLTPRGGFAFEDAVLLFGQRAVVGAPITFEKTANTTGSRPRCQVGDGVLRFTAESAYSGAGLVIEAKRDSSYTVPKALAELEVARANRLAVAGVFVFAKGHAPAGFPPFARYGVDVLVQWDQHDPSTDPYLHAAILLGLAVASRKQRPQDTGDIAALHDIEARIGSELKRLGEMKKTVETILRSANELNEHIRKGGDQLDLLLRKAKSTLTALNVELDETSSGTSNPVLLPAASLDNARGGLATQ